MADDAHKDEKKEAKPAKDPAAGPPAKSLLIPVIGGVVVLAALGGGVGMYVVKTLTPAAPAKPGAEDGHGGEPAHGEGGEAHGPADPHGGLLATGMELDPIDMKGNITGSGGTRYVTLQTAIWVPKKDHGKLNDAPVRRLIQSRLEEVLTTYQIEDLQSPNIKPRMKKDFATALERLLRSVQPGRAPEDKFVLEVSINALLTQ